MMLGSYYEKFSTIQRDAKICLDLFDIKQSSIE